MIATRLAFPSSQTDGNYMGDARLRPMAASDFHEIAEEEKARVSY